MFYLICEGKTFEIKDFYMTEDLCYIDMKLCNEVFQDFLGFYSDHIYGKGIFCIQVGEEVFKGWFGELLYDKEFNIRLCAGIYHLDEKIEKSEYGHVYTTNDSLWEIKNMLSVLCGILEEKGIVTNVQCIELKAMLNCPERVLDYKCLVKNLEKHLLEKNETLKELRSGEEH